MSDVKKATGSGTTASISTDGTEYKVFASITGLGPPSMSRGTVDVTDMNSYANNDQFKEYLGDFIEGDEMSIEGFFISEDEGRTAAESAFYSGDPVYIKIALPAAIGKTMTVVGIVTTYRPIGDIDTSNGIKFNLAIKPTKKPTLAAASTTSE